MLCQSFDASLLLLIDLLSENFVSCFPTQGVLWFCSVTVTGSFAAISLSVKDKAACAILTSSAALSGVMSIDSATICV